MGSVLLILLGWILGMANSLIVAGVQRRRRLEDLNRAILAELDELRFIFAWTSMKLCMRSGRVDKALLSWFRDVAAKYRGPQRDAELDKVAGNLANLDDAKIQALTGILQQPGRSIGIPRVLIPTVTANLTHVSGLPEEYQRHLFNVVRRVEIINQELDRGWYYFQQTFDTSLDQANRALVLGNVDSTYASIDRNCRWAVEVIDQLDKFRDYKFGLMAWFRDP